MDRHRHSVKSDLKKMPVEALATRVFISAPRILSFAHRPLLSLRHPFLRLVIDTVASSNLSGPRKVNTLLGLLLDSEGEGGKWKKVAAVFDVKADADEIASARQMLLTSYDLSSAMERLWCGLLRHGETTMTEETYRRFHEDLYAELLGVSDVSLAATMLIVISKDFTNDARGGTVVNFAAFATSMLEVADNWTATRSAADFISFVERLALRHAAAVNYRSPTHSPSPAPQRTASNDMRIGSELYYAGGVLSYDSKHNVYYKATM